MTPALSWCSGTAYPRVIFVHQYMNKMTLGSRLRRQSQKVHSSTFIRICVSGSKCSYFPRVKIIFIVSLNIWILSNVSYQIVWCVNANIAIAMATFCRNCSFFKSINFFKNRAKWYWLFWSEPQLFLKLFLFLVNFQPQCSYKIVLIKKEC